VVESIQAGTTKLRIGEQVLIEGALDSFQGLRKGEQMVEISWRDFMKIRRPLDLAKV